MTNRSHSSHTRANGQKRETVTWVGGSCGRHGSYTFYKAFRFRIFNGIHQPAPTSNVIVRTRMRERRNNLESDATTRQLGEEKQDSCRDAAEERILALGDFFFVQCRPEDPVCVGELQLLWHDRHSEQDLASTRLYYLPETTPAGRTAQHGEDELLAVSEKIVMRATDLASWIVEPDEWNYGSSLPFTPVPANHQITDFTHRYSLLHSSVNMSDVEKEKSTYASSSVNMLDASHCCKNGLSTNGAAASEPKGESLPVTSQSNKQCTAHCPKRFKAQVLVLNMSSYCRYKAMMKRLEGVKSDWLLRPRVSLILAKLGAFTTTNPKARIVFCRDTFDYPQLFEHDLICEELAPVFKGRPRRKIKKVGNTIGNKLPSRRVNEVGGIRTEGPSPDDLTNKDSEATTMTRRCSNRRRCKRKSPQRSLYEEQFASIASSKKTRRGSLRTPTPGDDVSDSSLESPASAPEANGGMFSAKTIGETIDGVARTAVGRARSKKKKKRPGPRSFAAILNYTLKQSLLESKRAKSSSDNCAEEAKKEAKDAISSTSTSSSSSRSQSPTAENSLGSNFKTRSPDSSASVFSSASNDLYASTSPSSPIDDSAIMGVEDGKLGLITSASSSHLRELRNGEMPENKAAFFDLLYRFMQERNTPIAKIPSLGFKKLDLWTFFKLSQEYGGYDMVTAKRLWKHVYDRMGGNPSCTSAATCTRKHFEKLLLPLESYLRRTIQRKAPKRKDGEEKKRKHFNEKSPLNGRAFNGVAYFHNGAKVNNVETSNDVSMAPASTVKSESRSETTFAPNMAGGTVLTNSTDSKRPPTSSVTSTSAPASFSLESLAHGIIQEEFLPEKQKDEEPKDLSVSSRIRAKSSPPHEEDEKSQAVESTSAEAVDDLSSDAQQILANMGVSNGEAHNLLASRTHVPRVQGVPPPAVPRRSGKAMISKQTEDKPLQPAEIAPMLRGDNELKLVGMRTLNPMVKEGSSLQKRSNPDVETAQDPRDSLCSPKRSRSTVTSPPSNNYAIHSLVSTTTAIDKPRAFGSHDLTFPANSRNLSSTQNARSTDFVNRRSNLQALSDEKRRILGSQETDKVWRPHADQEKVVDVKKLQPSTFYYPPSESNMTKERSYYRPNGMLATHREASKHHPASIPDSSHNQMMWNKQSADQLYVKQHLASHEGEIVKKNHLSPSRNPHQPDHSNNQPPPLITSQQQTNHLWSDPKLFPSAYPIKNSNPALHTVPMAMLGKQENSSKTHRSSPVQHPKSFSPRSTFSGERQHSYKAPSDKSNASSHSKSHHVPPRLESIYRQEPRLRENHKEVYPEPNRSSSKQSVSANEKVAAANTRAVLESLHPMVANALLPMLPKDCTPEMVAKLLQDTEKSLGLHPTPNGMPLFGGLPIAPHQFPLLQEMMLQQHLPEQHQLRLATHQEQQAAAAAQMAQAAMLSGFSSNHGQATPDQMALASMYHAYASHLAVYQQNAARQLLDTASQRGLPSKPFDNHELLEHMTRYGNQHLQELRNTGYVNLTPPFVPNVSPDIAAALAYSNFPRR